MDHYLTEADLADRFQVTVHVVGEWRRRYGWPHLKIGRTVRYTAAHVARIEQIHAVMIDPAVALSLRTGQTIGSARATLRQQGY